MRKIKFRGKRISDGTWLFGDLMHLEKDFKPLIKIMDWSTKDIEVNPETVGQFTGLTDKNGEKIYEGDVIRIHEGRDDFKLASIIWDNEYLCFEPTNKELRHALKSRHSEHYEVIGNIHDNPSLLTNK